MNTTTKYLKEIRYRKAKCCVNCKHFKKWTRVTYCRLHDNPIIETYVCKWYNKGTIKQS